MKTKNAEKIGQQEQHAALWILWGSVVGTIVLGVLFLQLALTRV